MTNPEFILHGENGVSRARYNSGEIHQLEPGDTTDFTFEIRDSDFADIKAYGDYAGDYTDYEAFDNTYKYQLHVPSNASVGSLLFGIEPSSDLQSKDVTGIWGLIDDLSDGRPAPLNRTTVELSMFVVAGYADYSTHSNAIDTLKING